VRPAEASTKLGLLAGGDDKDSDPVAVAIDLVAGNFVGLGMDVGIQIVTVQALGGVHAEVVGTWLPPGGIAVTIQVPGIGTGPNRNKPE